MSRNTDRLLAGFSAEFHFFDCIFCREITLICVLLVSFYLDILKVQTFENAWVAKFNLLFSYLPIEIAKIKPYEILGTLEVDTFSLSVLCVDKFQGHPTSILGKYLFGSRFEI